MPHNKWCTEIDRQKLVPTKYRHQIIVKDQNGKRNELAAEK